MDTTKLQISRRIYHLVRLVMADKIEKWDLDSGFYWIKLPHGWQQVTAFEVDELIRHL